MSLPVTLKDVHAPSSFTENLDNVTRNPTGKFYKDPHSVAMVETLKANGSFARVVVSDGASQEQKAHFDRFIVRLQTGELVSSSSIPLDSVTSTLLFAQFIQMNRTEPLAMCSAENGVLVGKLGFPAALVGLGGAVLVAQVTVENYSNYADAAGHADDSRW